MLTEFHTFHTHTRPPIIDTDAPSNAFRAINTPMLTHMHTHASNTFPNGFTSCLDDLHDSRIHMHTHTHLHAVTHTHTQTWKHTHTHIHSVIPFTSDKLVVALWLMQLSPPPSFPLNHTHTDLPYSPCFLAHPLLPSPLSYSHYLSPLLWLPFFYASIHLSALHTSFPLFNSLSIPTVLHLPLTLSVPQGGVPSKIFTWLWLMALIRLPGTLYLSLPPSSVHSVTLSPSTFSARQPAANWPKRLH